MKAMDMLEGILNYKLKDIAISTVYGLCISFGREAESCEIHTYELFIEKGDLALKMTDRSLIEGEVIQAISEASIERACIDESGRLVLLLSDGCKIKSGQSNTYESWELRTGSGTYVGLPGGLWDFWE